MYLGGSAENCRPSLSSAFAHQISSVSSEHYRVPRCVTQANRSSSVGNIAFQSRFADNHGTNIVYYGTSVPSSKIQFGTNEMIYQCSKFWINTVWLWEMCNAPEKLQFFGQVLWWIIFSVSFKVRWLFIMEHASQLEISNTKVYVRDLKSTIPTRLCN